MKDLTFILIVPPLLFLCGICYFIDFTDIVDILEKTKPKPYYYESKKIDRRKTGRLSALNTVEVGSQISGQIVRTYVDFNDEVKENQLIAELDDSYFKVKVLQAKSRLEREKANQLRNYAILKQLQSSMISAKADLVKSEAKVKKAEINLVAIERNHRRKKELYEKKLISESELEAVETTSNITKNELEVARAKLKISKAKIDAINNQIEAQNADLEKQKARISQREAQLSLAQINLDRTKIYSPINGRIISRHVNEGQTVVSDYETPKLFTIAPNLRQMQIDLKVEESDLKTVKEGQNISFTVFAYKGKIFKGIIDKIKISSDNESKSLLVNVENKELLLMPGMTVKTKLSS